VGTSKRSKSDVTSKIVSIQLISPASGDSFCESGYYSQAGLVSIQLISPASGDFF
jgi:hypothetical protein